MTAEGSPDRVAEDVADAFDALIEGTAAAMAVVTVSVDGEPSGCLVGFHGQCSIEPRRYALWLSKANHTYDLAVQADTFAVHLLASGDEQLAAHFGGRTGDEEDKFATVGWAPGPGGVPLLEDCPRRLVLRRVALLDSGGDHTCVVGEPVAAAGSGEFTPLRLPDVVGLEPGHQADEPRHTG